MEPVFEEGDTSNILPVDDAAAIDDREDTIDFGDAELPINLEAEAESARVSLLEQKKETDDFQDMEQNTTKGLLKMLLDNQKAFQVPQKALQKKLESQEKELQTLRHVSEPDSDEDYDTGVSGVDFRPRRKKKRQRIGRLSETLGYDADLSISPEPKPTNTQRSKFVLNEDSPDKDLINSCLVLRQENYGDPTTSSKQNSASMKLATEPLAVKLGVTDGHKILPSSCGGGHEQDQKNFVHIQTRLMTTRQKVDELEELSLIHI